MEMQQVRYFLAVAKVLNFTRAAEQCNVTQPALTRAIKQLEEELGGELIRREGRLSHLTDLGHRMLPLLTQCFESAINAKALAAKVKQGDLASLAIGVSRSLDLDLLLGALAEMYRAFPGLQLKLRRGNGAQIVGWLKNGDVELAFGGPLGESWDRLDCWPMFTEAFDVVVSPEHDIAKLNDPDLDFDLVRRERLLVHADNDHLEMAPSSFEAVGLSLSDAHQVDSNRDLEALVIARFGVAILPASALRSDRIKRIPCGALDMRRTVAVYSIAGRARSREAAALLNLVRAADWSSAVAA